MKLTELIPFTSDWLGIPQTQVRTIAYELRAAGLISSGGRGAGGAEMSVEDKINLMLGVCGVEVAKRAPDHVRVWRRLTRNKPDSSEHSFHFIKATTVQDFLVDLITKDLKPDGPLDIWLREADRALAKVLKGNGKNKHVRDEVPNHQIILDFYVDAFGLTCTVSRYCTLNEGPHQELRRSASDSLEIHFSQPLPRSVGGEHNFVSPHKDDGFRANSALIRRLTEQNLRGWGECLRA